MKITIELDDIGRPYLKEPKPTNPDQNLLQQLDTSNNSNDAKTITKIIVNPGPGKSFSGTREAVTIANALGYALQVPVNDKEFEIPTYHQAPSITKSKNQ